MRKTIIASTLAAAAIAGTVGMASPASANTGETAYLQLISAHGNIINDASRAISRGYQLCGLIESYGGADAARMFYANTSYGETPNLHEAQVMVNDAASTLCPWTWSRGIEANAA